MGRRVTPQGRVRRSGLRDGRHVVARAFLAETGVLAPSRHDGRARLRRRRGVPARSCSAAARSAVAELCLARRRGAASARLRPRGALALARLALWRPIGGELVEPRVGLGSAFVSTAQSSWRSSPQGAGQAATSTVVEHAPREGARPGRRGPQKRRKLFRAGTSRRGGPTRAGSPRNRRRHRWVRKWGGGGSPPRRTAQRRGDARGAERVGGADGEGEADTRIGIS